MIDKKVAAALADRFSGLNWYPREGPAQIELIQAVESAENEFIGTYVVNEWIKYEPECPKPSELRSLIRVENQKLWDERARESEQESSRRSTCPKCHGFGIVESIIIKTTIGAQTPIESVCNYCSCPDGRRRERRASIPRDEPGWDEYGVKAIIDARSKLMKRFGTAKIGEIVAAFVVSQSIEVEEYNGDF